MCENIIYWGRASSCLSDPLLGKILPCHRQWVGSASVLFVLLQGIRDCFHCIKCSGSSISFHLRVLRFLSLILLTFLVPGIEETLLGPSRAGSWHQHGDFKTPQNVLLAAQHSLDSVGQDLRLSQTLNSLESFSTVEVSLAGDQVI